LHFAQGTAAAPEQKGEVRASFPGGESLGFTLKSWEGGHVTGTSGTFGELNFNTRGIRQLTFGPGNGTGTSAGAPENSEFLEFE
jgi:hypothetical protein